MLSADQALCCGSRCELGLLEPDKARAIIEAAREAMTGKHDRHFVVDIFQIGSGTSTNMNANEVIASLARLSLGLDQSDRQGVHPNDDVNKGQSSNDVIPSATHLAALLDIEEKLLPALAGLRRAFADKSAQFIPVIKIGRTHLQDATPISLGQVFFGYQGQIERAMKRLARELPACRIGSGWNGCRYRHQHAC